MKTLNSIHPVILLFLLIVLVFLVYSFGGHDQTARDILLASFAAFLAMVDPRRRDPDQGAIPSNVRLQNPPLADSALQKDKPAVTTETSLS